MNLTTIDRKTFKLVGGRCPECAAFSFPRKPTCSVCKHREVEERLLSGTGTVYAFTIMRVRPPKGFTVPYALGYVLLDQEQLVVPALFSGTEEQLQFISINDPVVLMENDQQHAADYIFKLLPKDQDLKLT